MRVKFDFDGPACKVDCRKVFRLVARLRLTCLRLHYTTVWSALCVTPSAAILLYGYMLLELAVDKRYDAGQLKD